MQPNEALRCFRVRSEYCARVVEVAARGGSSCACWSAVGGGTHVSAAVGAPDSTAAVGELPLVPLYSLVHLYTWHPLILIKYSDPHVLMTSTNAYTKKKQSAKCVSGKKARSRFLEDEVKFSLVQGNDWPVSLQ